MRNFYSSFARSMRNRPDVVKVWERRVRGSGMAFLEARNCGYSMICQYRRAKSYPTLAVDESLLASKFGNIVPSTKLKFSSHTTSDSHSTKNQKMLNIPENRGCIEDKISRGELLARI